jgi:hypothetical protein
MAESATKKQKTAQHKRVQLIDDFHLKDVHTQSIIKNTTCHIVPLVYGFDKKSAVLVQLSGGGVIPLSFGIDDKDMGGRRKVMLALQIDSDSDHDHLVRLRTELIDLCSTHWSTWYPEQTVPALETLCGTLVSIRKKKQNSEDHWPGVAKASIEPRDCTTGACKIVDRDSGKSVPFCNLPGMVWHKAIFEFRYIYIQATQSFGFTKKLRYLSCSEGEEYCEAVPI